MYTEDGTKVGEVCAAMDIRFKTQPQRTSFEQSELLADTDPGLLLYPLGFGEDPLRPRPGLADRPGVAWPGDGTSRSALSDADLSLLSAIQEASNESHPTALSLSCAHRTKNDGTGGVSLLGGSTVSEEVFTPGAAPPWTPGASAGRPQQAGRSAATPQAAAASLPRRARTLMQESDDEVAARVMRMLNEDCAEDMPFDGGGSGSGAGGGSASAPGGIASRCRGSAETVPERRVAADDADVRASAARRALHYGTVAACAASGSSRPSATPASSDPLLPAAVEAGGQDAAGAAPRRQDLLDTLLSKGRRLMEKLDALAAAPPSPPATPLAGSASPSPRAAPSLVAAQALAALSSASRREIAGARPRLSPSTVFSTPPAAAAAGLSAGWDESTLRAEGPAGGSRWSPYGGGGGGADDVCRSGLEEDSSLSPFASPAGGGGGGGIGGVSSSVGGGLPRRGTSGKFPDQAAQADIADGAPASALEGSSPVPPSAPDHETRGPGPGPPQCAAMGRGGGSSRAGEHSEINCSVGRNGLARNYDLGSGGGGGRAGGGGAEPDVGEGARSGAGGGLGSGSVARGGRGGGIDGGGDCGGVSKGGGGGSGSNGGGGDEGGFLEVHITGVAVGRLALRPGDALCVDVVASLPAPPGDRVGDALQAQARRRRALRAAPYRAAPLAVLPAPHACTTGSTYP